MTVLVLAIISAVGAATYYPRYNSAQRYGTGGQILVSSRASIWVYSTGTNTLVQLYSNATGSTLSQPVIADNYGNYTYYATSGWYDEVIVGPAGTSPVTLVNVPIGMTQDRANMTVYGSSIHTMLSTVGSSSITVVVSTSITVNDAFVIPSNISIQVVKGGLFVKSGSGTLTINGPFNAGLYQVFSGFSSGDVTFGSGSVNYISDSWFGMKNDGLDASASTNNDAINVLIASAINIRHIKFRGGTYVFSNTILFHELYGTDYIVEGERNLLAGADAGLHGTKFRVAGSGNAATTLLEIRGVQHATFRSITLQGNNDNVDSHRSLYGIYLQQAVGQQVSTSNTFDDFQIFQFATGIRIGSATWNHGSNDYMIFNNLYMSLCNIGIHQTWPNAIGSIFNNSQVVNTTIGLAIGGSISPAAVNGYTPAAEVANSQTGSITINGMVWGHNATNVHFYNYCESLLINNARIENSMQFISSQAGIGSGARIGGQLNIIGGVFTAQTNPDGTPIIGPPPVLVDSINSVNNFMGFDFGGYTDTIPTPFKFAYAGVVNFDGCRFIGNAFLTDGTALGDSYTVKNCMYWNGAAYIPTSGSASAIHTLLTTTNDTAIVAIPAGTNLTQYKIESSFLASNAGQTVQIHATWEDALSINNDVDLYNAAVGRNGTFFVPTYSLISAGTGTITVKAKSTVGNVTWISSTISQIK